MDDVPFTVDRPRGQSDGILVVSWKRGKWEIQEPLALVVNDVPPAIVATVDPSKRRDRGVRRDYSSHRLFEAY